MDTLMSRVECPACHGQYDDVDRHGIRYFHACPPLSSVELAAAITARTVVLSPADATRLHDAQVADATTPGTPGDATRVDQVLGALVVHRPNHRDENQPGTPAPIAIGPGAGGVADPVGP